MDSIVFSISNKPQTVGLALQALETYKEFIDTDDISFGGNNFEPYFEEADFDKFADNLQKYNVYPVKEHSWGQRVFCFYDQDRHSIDVGETMKAVCKSFIDSGMTPEQTAERMDVLVEYVNECMWWHLQETEQSKMQNLRG